MAKEKKKAIQSEKSISYSSIFKYLHDVISRVNESKIFAGVMIIILNIASRFVTIKLSKSMESYLKYTFSKQLLIDAKVAVSPGIGFGEYGEGYVRFSLIENEHRTRQAIRGIKQFLSKNRNIHAIG